MTNKRYTDEEIVRALECCLCDNSECLQCQNKELCRIERDELAVKTLDLINRKMEEIERLKSANDEKFRQWDILTEKTKQHYADLYNEAKDIVKAEAYKEFAKEVSEEIKKAYNNNSDILREHLIKHKENPNFEFIAALQSKMNTLRGLDDFIDNLLKEMVGEKE